MTFYRDTQLIGHGFIFQHNNDPKHTSTLCKMYLKNKEKQKKLVNMDWPPQNPDLNPIELLWDELDREVRKLQLTNRNQLLEYLQVCWCELEPEKLKKLVSKMFKVCAVVLLKKAHILMNQKFELFLVISEKFLSLV